MIVPISTIELLSASCCQGDSNLSDVTPLSASLEERRGFPVSRTNFSRRVSREFGDIMGRSRGISYGGFLSYGGTPNSSSISNDGIFHEINHPLLGNHHMGRSCGTKKTNILGTDFVKYFAVSSNLAHAGDFSI